MLSFDGKAITDLPKFSWLPAEFTMKNYEYAFHKGLASGSASAFSEQLATKEEVEALLRKIEGR